jgi:hypothetical protein
MVRVSSAKAKGLKVRAKSKLKREMGRGKNFLNLNTASLLFY